MNETEIARLLALDRRTPRFPSIQPRCTMFDMYVSSRAETARLRMALRDLLAIHDAPPEHRHVWNDPARKRLEEIRKMAAQL